MKNSTMSKHYGIGLRPAHYSEILSRKTAIDWFEITPENYMGLEGHGCGRPYDVLKEMAKDYPIAFHGVTMSLGSSDPLDLKYLKRLKKLADEFNPFALSDHLCFSSIDREYVYDLLPIPYTEESLKNVVKKIMQAQDYLERPLSIENVSSYIEYKVSQTTEWNFLKEVIAESKCGLILDINNIYVSSVNHHFDAKEYLRAIPHERVTYIHLAGHSTFGEYLIDTHDHDVPKAVWNLYDHYVSTYGLKKTMIERDDNIPELKSLEKEIGIARTIGEKLKFIQRKKLQRNIDAINVT